MSKTFFIYWLIRGKNNTTFIKIGMDNLLNSFIMLTGFNTFTVEHTSNTEIKKVQQCLLLCLVQ